MNNISNVMWRQASALRIAKEYVQDCLRYTKYSIPLRRQMLATITGKHLEAQVTKDYHRIEKGLTLPSPRRPFGSDARDRLQEAFQNAVMSDESSATFASYANDALKSLDRYNSTAEIDDYISPRLSSLGSLPNSANVAAALLESRRSIRNFDTNRVISESHIVEAVRLAGLSPSVCNRQASRAYYYSGRSNVDRILKHQSGNRGFGHTAQGIFVITSDQRMFGGSGERNQSWIDGALFAMSLVLALHGMGIGTCMLNWSKKNHESHLLRKDADIPHSENIIVMIAVGYPVDDSRVARSPRRPISDILTINSEG